MRAFLQRWHPRHLLASWAAYWVALLAIVLGPSIARWWELQREARHGRVTFRYEANGLETALWIAGPPLLLWVLWLAARPRREHVATSRDEPVA